MNFKNLSKEELKRISAKGGKNSHKQYNAKKKQSLEEVVRDQVKYEDLVAIAKGLIDSGKKGNVKAVDSILKILNKDADKPTTIDDFLKQTDD